MTLSTSAVAVCCCSASLSSRGARLHLLEEAHILDRDDRLVGEALHELDLARGKRPGSSPRQAENTDDLVPRLSGTERPRGSRR